jgi:methylenetetrahydrofolate reductase (NADPH)
MSQNSKLANMISAGNFIITAEFLPLPTADGKAAGDAAAFFKDHVTAVNVADNPHGPILSSLAGSVILERAGIEAVYQMVTRDRNRIALQSDLLGAAALGVKNVLCLSGHHQTLTGSRESASVYDIDSIQLIAAVKQMNDDGALLDGTKIAGDFSVLAGAVATPDMKPLELNMMRLAKKVAAGARFIQTQAVFDFDAFARWIKEAHQLGITSQTAILAGVMPLESADEAESLRNKYTDLVIPDSMVERLKAAGDAAGSSKENMAKEGMAICIETIKKVKSIEGVRGIHILSGGKEHLVPEIIKKAGL